MMLQIALGCVVAILTLASAANNYQHMASFGWSITVLVIGAELAKPLLPVAMTRHYENASTTQLIATLMMWLLVVAFSIANTFGNTLTRHAMEKVRLEQAKGTETRAEHIILRDIAQIPICREITRIEKRKTVREPDTACEASRAERIAPLTAELKLTKSRTGTADATPIDKHTVEDGYLTLAAMFGFSPKRYEVAIYMVLLWTLLAEVGSALGGLTIPRGKRE